MPNWTNLDPTFTAQLQAEWETRGFTYQNTQDWINIGLTPAEANFAHWLTNEGYTALAVLDFGDAEQLRTAYQTSLKEPKKPSRSLPTNNWPWKAILAILVLTLLISLFKWPIFKTD